MIGYRQGVSIVVLIFYIPALAIAIFLSIRHGFRRASGWRFMIIFTLARVLGSCLELSNDQPAKELLTIHRLRDTDQYRLVATRARSLRAAEPSDFECQSQRTNIGYPQASTAR